MIRRDADLRSLGVFNIFSTSFISFVLASTVAMSCANAAPKKVSSKAPQPSIEFLEKKMTREGFSKSFIQDVLATYEPKDFDTVIELNVLLFLRKSNYHGIQVTDDAEKEVRKFLTENKDAFEKAERTYQVPTSVIASLLFIESRFGKNAGGFHVPSAYLHLIQSTRAVVQKYLLTRTSRYADRVTGEQRKEIMARTHRKSDWAVEELRALEKVHQWKWSMGREFRGSFSGAFGMPQFLPSSYIKWARSINHPAQPNLAVPADAIASVAHYLADHGWKADQYEAQFAALMKYNNSRDYANAILALAQKITPRSVASLPAPLVLKPFKDELFAHGKALSSSHGGLLTVFDYNEMRDINGRDEIPVKKANAKYVAELPADVQRPLVIKVKKRKLEAFEVGAAKDAKFAVIFIHGKNGTRDLAVNDWTFSGNFNRLKNLAVENGGSYYTPTVRDLEGPSGAEDIVALLEYISQVSPKAPIVLACASSGGYICSNVAKTEAGAKRLGGLMLMGTTSAASVLNSPAMEYRVPILFTQGTRDSLCPYPAQVAQFEKILKADPNYPTVFIGFNSGGHGTPIRMIDWRESLNWIFAAKRE